MKKIIILICLLFVGSVGAHAGFVVNAFGGYNFIFSEDESDRVIVDNGLFSFGIMGRYEIKFISFGMLTGVFRFYNTRIIDTGIKFIAHDDAFPCIAFGRIEFAHFFILGGSGLYCIRIYGYAKIDEGNYEERYLKYIYMPGYTLGCGYEFSFLRFKLMVGILFNHFLYKYDDVSMKENVLTFYIGGGFDFTKK